MVAAARPGFDPYANLTVEAGSIFGGIKRSIRRATKPVGATFRAAAKTSVGKGAIQLAKVAGPVPLLGVVPGASAQVDRALDALSRGNFRAAGRASIGAGVELAPIVQQTLKQFGPPGLAASAAIGALATGAKGGNLEEMAWSAAEGGAPQGIDTAIKAAHEIRRGGSPANVALGLMSKNLVPGSPAAQGFNLAQQVLSGNAGAATGEIVTKLGAERRQLPTEQARRGFDLAIGTISRATRKGGAPNAKPLSGPRVQILRAPRRLPMTAAGGAHDLATSMLQARPHLAQESLATVSRVLRVSPTTARQAMRSIASRYQWRPLTSSAARFIQRFAPASAQVALRDTRGLSDANTIYVVEPGDGPQRIGDKLLGPGQGVKRWKELIKANPSKSVDPKTGNFKILAVAERLKLPASWTADINARSSSPATATASSASTTGKRFTVVQKGDGPFQIAARLTGDGNRRKELVSANIPVDADGRQRKSDGAGGFKPGLNPGERLFVPAGWPAHPLALPFAAAPVATSPLPTVPLPVSVTPPAPALGPGQDVATVLQAKAILAAWGKTDGLNEAGFPDYGARAEDLTPTFGPRDRFVLSSFVSWSNRTQRTALASGSELLPEHVAALRAWAEKRAALPLPPASPAPSVPSPLPPIGLPLPPVVPPSSTPATPPTSSSPSTPPALPGPPSASTKTAKADDKGGGSLAPVLAIALPLAAVLVK